MKVCGLLDSDGILWTRAIFVNSSSSSLQPIPKSWCFLYPTRPINFGGFSDTVSDSDSAIARKVDPSIASPYSCTAVWDTPSMIAISSDSVSLNISGPCFAKTRDRPVTWELNSWAGLPTARAKTGMV